MVIPTFNRERTIVRAIDSAAGQTVDPLEIVVVDDGSSDRTVEILASFGDRIRVIVQPNAGAASARNRAVEAARGEWIAFLDSDDHWPEDHLERMGSAIAGSNGLADVYFADCSYEGAAGFESLWREAAFVASEPYQVIADATPWVMLPLHPFAVTATVVRRSRYLAVGGMWPALRSREDTHLYFLMGFGHPFCAVGGAPVVVTDDDRSGGRLTTAAGSQTSAYADYTVALYRDVLDRLPHLAGPDRSELQDRLSDGYLSQASMAWHERALSAMPSLLWRAAVVSPGHVARRARSFAGRVIGGRRRSAG